MRTLLALGFVLVFAGSVDAQNNGFFPSGGSTPCTTTASSLQYNSAGAFGCISGWTTNGTTTLTGGSGTSIAINGATIGSYSAASIGSIGIFGATTTGPDVEVLITGDTNARVALGVTTTDVARLSMGPGNAVRDLFLERAGAANLRHGAPDAAAPVAQSISVQNVVAGTSNTAGAAIAIKGSQGTGTGLGGSIIFQVAPAGSTGTSQNALATALTIDSTKLLTVPGAIAIGGATIGSNALAWTGTADGAGGTVTTSQPVLNLTQTWNAGAVTFAGIKLNITDTASAAASLLTDIQVGGSSKAQLDKAGVLWATGLVAGTGATPALGSTSQISVWNAGVQGVALVPSQGVNLRNDGSIRWSSTSSSQGSIDLVLTRDAPNTHAWRNGTTAQIGRLYGSWTDASNGDWIETSKAAGGAAYIRTVKNGTGTASTLSLGVAGTNYWTIDTSGDWVGTAATDASSVATGAFQTAGGGVVTKRFWIPGITTSAGLQTAVLCQSSGGEMIADSVACLASAARFKDVRGPMPDGALAKLARLPIDLWSYKAEGQFASDDWTRERIGPLADDVAAMDPRLAGYDKDGNVRTYSTEQLLAFTIKAVQELKADNDNLRDEIKRRAAR